MTTLVTVRIPELRTPGEFEEYEFWFEQVPAIGEHVIVDDLLYEVKRVTWEPSAEDKNEYLAAVVVRRA